jgi:hypothetical protein
VERIIQKEGLHCYEYAGAANSRTPKIGKKKGSGFVGVPDGI